jgi:mitogen-activated protein kinase organizer 1
VHSRISFLPSLPLSSTALLSLYLAMPSYLPTTPLYTLPSHSAPVNALVFSTPTAPTIPYILTGSSDRSIHLSNPNRGIPFSSASTSSITSRPAKPHSTAYRAKDKNLPPPPGLIHSYEAHGYPVLDIAVTRDNARFVSGGGDKQVFLWDVETGQTSRRFGGGFGQASGHAGRVECVGFGGDEESVVISGMYIGRGRGIWVYSSFGRWGARWRASLDVSVLDLHSSSCSLFK